MQTKKIWLLLVICALLSGCTQDEYSIERSFFSVQKRAAAIVKNPDATPPAEVKKVVDTLGAFLNKYPDSRLAVESQFSIVRVYIARKEFDKAQAQLKSINEIFKKSEPVCAEVVFMRGTVYEAQDNWPSALAQYKTLAQAYPTTPRGFESLLFIALRYKTMFQPDLMIQAYKDAVAFYKEMALKYPKTGIALKSQLMIAQVSAELKDWNSAIYALNVVIGNFKDKVPTDTMMLDVANIYYKELKDTPKAVAMINKMITEFPKSPNVKLAKILLERFEKGQK